MELAILDERSRENVSLQETEDHSVSETYSPSTNTTFQ